MSKYRNISRAVTHRLRLRIPRHQADEALYVMIKLYQVKEKKHRPSEIENMKLSVCKSSIIGMRVDAVSVKSSNRDDEPVAGRQNRDSQQG
jgi:hypothetical protein